MRISFLISVFFLVITSLSSQRGEIHFSSKIEFGLNYRSKTYVSISASVGFKRYYFRESPENDVYEFIGRHSTGAVQTGIHMYYNGLGDNILDEEKKLHFDFIASILISAGIPSNHEILRNNIQISPLHSFLANAVYDEFLHSASLGSSVILNFEQRNQILGFANLNIARTLVFGYYNDGPPFGNVGLGDRYDRWWTGGGFGEIYLDQGIKPDVPAYLLDSKISYTFDRFTGNVQNAYNVSGTFSFRYVPAAESVENYYNRARGKIGINLFQDRFQLSAQWLGHLNNDVQNKIHKLLNMPFHLTYAERYFIFGIQYNQSTKLINL